MDRMKYITVTILFILVTLSCVAQHYQTRPISIAVMDEDNLPLKSASVLLLGRHGNIVAKGDGTFTVYLNSDADTLIVSHLNYHKQKIGINNNSKASIKVTLVRAKATKLEEVVVNTGYQSLPKER